MFGPLIETLYKYIYASLISVYIAKSDDKHNDYLNVYLKEICIV